MDHKFMGWNAARANLYRNFNLGPGPGRDERRELLDLVGSSFANLMFSLRCSVLRSGVPGEMPHGLD
jgi:hypothetical protein